jgi:hypothetical protein
VEELVHTLRRTVAPSSWTTDATIAPLAGNLYVAQSPANHAAIERFLAGLRRQCRTQIVLEFRLVSFDRGGRLASLPDDLRRRPEPAGSGGDAGPVESVNLSPADANRLRGALQFNASLTMRTAPRLTLFSGQAASVLVASQRAFVSAVVNLKNADGTTSQSANVDVVSSGTQIHAKAVASPDGQFATVALRAEMADLISIDGPDVKWPDPAVVQRPIVERLATQGTVVVRQGDTCVLRVPATPSSVPPGRSPATRAGETQPGLLLLVKVAIRVPEIDPHEGVILGKP